MRMKEVSSANHCNLSGLIVLVVAAAPRLEVPRGLSQYGRWMARQLCVGSGHREEVLTFVDHPERVGVSNGRGIAASTAKGWSTVTDTVTVGRTRGGERRERILAAAAELIADRGYHAVSMADIGISAGVVGPAIYRHFDSKAGLLAALFEQVIDTLLRRASAIVEQSRDDREALTALVADHVALVMEKRELAIVYYREVHNLPDHRRSRLRRKQRLYVEEWVHVLGELRPELDETELRAVVHGAIGAIQSTLQYRDTGMPPERVSVLLARMGHAVLGVPPCESHSEDRASHALPQRRGRR